MKTKRIIQLWLITMAIIVLTAVAGYASTYYINNLSDLQNMDNNPDLQGNYILTNNIDASSTSTWNGGAGFAPIGTASSPFTGSFNGNNYTISGLYINRPTTTDVGFFGCANLGTNQIQKINVVVNNITGKTSADSCFAGGLVGNLVSGTLSNSSVTLNPSNTIIAYRAGGLVGWNEGTIQNSYSIINGTVSGTYSTGGFVGPNDGTIRNSYSIVNGTITGAVQIGGFVGGSRAFIVTTPLIIDCYASLTSNAKIIATNGGSGGFAGGLTLSNVYNSYATGASGATIQVGPGGELGGFSGLYNYGNLSNDSWYTGIAGGSLNAVGYDMTRGNNPVSLLSSVGYGTDLPTSSAFDVSSNAVYTNSPVWDFTNTWFARPDNTPVLISNMQNWVRGGGTALGLTLSDQDILTLMNTYASMGSTALGGYTWTYMSGNLPGDINGTTYNYGDIWTYNGHTYLKLGSGDEIDPMGGGAPEPATIVGLGLMVIAAGLRRMRKA